MSGGTKGRSTEPNARTGGETRKTTRKTEHTLGPPIRNLSAPSILRHGRGNLSLNASCSSDASSESSHSRASTGKISAPRMRRKQGGIGRNMEMEIGNGEKKRCAWVTNNTGTSRTLKFYVSSFRHLEQGGKTKELVCLFAGLEDDTIEVVGGWGRNEMGAEIRSYLSC